MKSSPGCCKMKVFPYIPFETSTKTCCFLRNKGLSKWGGYSIDLFTPHFFLSRRALSQAITSLYLIPKWGEPKGGVGWENDDPMSVAKVATDSPVKLFFTSLKSTMGTWKLTPTEEIPFWRLSGFLVLIFGVSFGVIVARYPGSLGISHYHLSGGAYPAARSFWPSSGLTL